MRIRSVRNHSPLGGRTLSAGGTQVPNYLLISRQRGGKERRKREIFATSVSMSGKDYPLLPFIPITHESPQLDVRGCLICVPSTYQVWCVADGQKQVRVDQEYEGETLLNL